MRTNVLIADSCPVVVQGLRKALGAQRNFEIVACCSDGTSCIEAIRNLRPDIAVLDNSMPGLTGLRSFSASLTPRVFPPRVVFFTASVGDSELVELAAAGAYGVILKNAALEFLVNALRRAPMGRGCLPLPCSDQVSREQSAVTAALTNREHQIRLGSESLSNKEIGRQLNICDGTIKVHLHHIYEKLEISNRTALAAVAISQRSNSRDNKTGIDELLA